MEPTVPKRDPFDLTTDSRGNLKRTIGKKWKDDGSDIIPATFYLGRDRAAAGVASVNLGKAWDAVCERWYRRKDTEFPLWDEVTYPIAMAVAASKDHVAVTYPLEEDIDLLQWGEKLDMEISHWLAELRGMFPFIQIELANGQLRDKVGFTLDCAEDRAEKKLAEVRQLKGKAGGKTLAEALQGYEEYAAKKYQRDGRPTEFAGLVRRRIAALREHLGDGVNTLLAGVDTAFLDEWVLYWQNRPANKRGGAVSREWAKGVIKQVRDFVRWLNRRVAEYGWRTPPDHQVLPARVKPTPEEIVTAKAKRRRYKRDELAVLWEYARPQERVLLVLALNCGFGAREIETLGLAEVDLDNALIDKTRTKTLVRGKWRLWPETVAGLRWYLARRPQSDSPLVFVKAGGKPFLTQTKGDNRGQTIPNAWDRLYKRVAKDHPEFVKLSFNKLRKTGPDWVRKHHSDELADMMLGHGKAGVLDAYTGKPVRRLFRALRRYRRFLAPVFTVPDPFAAPALKKNTALSLGTIKRIQDLRRQGYTMKKTAELVGVCVDSVRRYGSRDKIGLLPPDPPPDRISGPPT
jgi:integrase